MSSTITKRTFLMRESKSEVEYYIILSLPNQNSMDIFLKEASSPEISSVYYFKNLTLASLKQMDRAFGEVNDVQMLFHSFAKMIEENLLKLFVADDKATLSFFSWHQEITIVIYRDKGLEEKNIDHLFLLLNGLKDSFSAFEKEIKKNSLSLNSFNKPQEVQETTWINLYYEMVSLFSKEFDKIIESESKISSAIDEGYSMRNKVNFSLKNLKKKLQYSTEKIPKPSDKPRVIESLFEEILAQKNSIENVQEYLIIPSLKSGDFEYFRNIQEKIKYHVKEVMKVRDTFLNVTSKLIKENYCKIYKEIINLENALLSRFTFDKMRLIKKIEDNSDKISFLYKVNIKEKEYFISCLMDGTISFYEVENFTCVKKILTNRGLISSICYLPNNVFVISFEDKIKLWEITEHFDKCIKTISEHTDVVIKVIPLRSSRFASCSVDSTIKIWKATPPYTCLKTLQGHEGPVQSIIELSQRDYIVSGNYLDDLTLRFWNDFSYACEKIIQNIPCADNNSLMEINNDKIAVGGPEAIYIINSWTFQVESIIESRSLGTVKCFEFFMDSFICGCDSGILFHFNSQTFEYIGQRECHTSEITCSLKLDGNIIITGSSDKSIKIWKY